MAILDTHKAYTALAAGGFTETQAQTLIEALGESRDALATKADIANMATTADLEALRMATTADLEALRVATRADLEALRVATEAGLRELEMRVDARFDSVEARFVALEQRMTIRLGAMLIAAVALIVTIQGFLFALFLSA